jgi:hypothetical protein
MRVGTMTSDIFYPKTAPYLHERTKSQAMNLGNMQKENPSLCCVLNIKIGHVGVKPVSNSFTNSTKGRVTIFNRRFVPAPMFVFALKIL